MSQFTSSGKWKDFLSVRTDTYAILQLKRFPKSARERWFCSLAELESMGMTPEPGHYEMVYMAPLPSFSDRYSLMEKLYVIFNLDPPESYTGHSISVSDVIALKMDEEVFCFFVDRAGFEELAGFWNEFVAGQEGLS